jgi:hypothetical protein
MIAFCIRFSTIACCPYLICSSVCNYSLHSGLFLSVLNIIHVLDLGSVCLIPNIYTYKYYSQHGLYPCNCNCNLFAIRTSEIGYNPVDMDIVIYILSNNIQDGREVTIHPDIMNLRLNLS